MASKGKAVLEKDSSGGKRKRGDNDNAAKNGGLKRKNRNVLQFFDDAAVEFDADSDSGSDEFLDDDDFVDDFNLDPKVKSEPGRFEQVPFFPKEEELSGDELEKMLEERYRTGSGYVRYAEDEYDSKRSVDKSFLMPTGVEPVIWKVKCKVGREKNTVFCLIQKYVDLKVLGTKLQIISAFAAEHIKGFVFVEAEKQSDVTEACNQLADVYYSLVTKVPSNEVGQLLAVKKRYNEIKEGSWARVKNGIYRGDLAQVVAVNNERKRATVKLIPRIDLQALTEKYGGGAVGKRTKGSVPAARLITSSDLEEFRPLIQYRRDRDTGKMFEFLDSLMLKDGFLYKKVSIESLSFWGVNPSEDELQKFTIPSNDESDNLEWLSQLYGEQKKKSNVKIDKGGGKGEGSSGSHEHTSFEIHDLVHFGKRDFGMVIVMEKGENYKILKDGSDGPVTLTLGEKELKYVPLDKKFTALDHRMKTISISDAVKILDGPTKGRQGIVKQVYRGVIFLYDENDMDNAYFCTKSQMSEKVKHADTTCHGKDDGGPSSFEDVPSSPKSPLLPEKPWQMRGNISDVDRTGKDEMFSVGQSLRIRVGPLKGYLCRVLAVRYSDVTVKLDSQQKVLTVKRDHLSEVRAQSSTSSVRDDPESSSPFKPFDLLGTEGNTNDWLQQASTSANGDGWNVGGLSTDRSSWPAFPSSGVSLQVGTAATDLPSSVDNGCSNDTSWLSKVAGGNEKAVDNSDQVGGWGSSAGGWKKEKAPGGDHGGSWNIGGSSSSHEKADNVCESDPWMKGQKVTNATNSWCIQSAEKGQLDSWDKGRRTDDIGSGSSGWGKAGGVSCAEPKESNDPAADSWGKEADRWGKKNNSDINDTWSKSKDAENKGSEAPCEDPWGKVVDKWGGDKDGSNRSNEWRSSTNKPACDNKSWGISSGGWTNSQEVNNDSDGKVSGGWKSNGDGGIGGSWSKGRGFGAEGIGGNDAWGQAKSFENDRGFGRGRGRGRDQSGRGRGRGRSFDRGQSSGFNKDNQDSYSSGNNGWKDQHGSSWGKSSVENDGLTGSWDKGKSRNENTDQKSWNKSNEPDKNAGGWSLEKSSSQTGWNSASSGSSSWGQKTWEKGKGLSSEVAALENSMEPRDRATSMDVGGGWAQGNYTQDKHIGSSDDSWGKAAEKSNNNFSASQGWKNNARGQTSEENAMGGWKMNDTSTSSGWSKGGDVSQGKNWGSEGSESWIKPSGSNSWGKQRDSENDQGPGWGNGSGGRRGGRGFRGGRDQSGRGGSGRSGGRGQFFSGKNESQGGSTWGNSSGRNNEEPSWSSGWSNDEAGRDRSWKKPGEGGSSWGCESADKFNGDKSSWRKGWSSGGAGENKGWSKPSEGGSSWGVGDKGKTSAGGSEGGWKKTNEGGSSWGGGSRDFTSGGNNVGSNSNKGWGSGDGAEKKGWSKPGGGGSSWGSDITSGGNNIGSNSNKSWGSGDGAEEKGWSKPGGDVSSWGSGSDNQKSGWE